MRNQAYKNLLFLPPLPKLPPSIPHSGWQCVRLVGVCVPVCDIDPRHATVIGLRVASAQETTGTDSRWHREAQRGERGHGAYSAF